MRRDESACLNPAGRVTVGRSLDLADPTNTGLPPANCSVSILKKPARLCQIRRGGLSLFGDPASRIEAMSRRNFRLNHSRDLGHGERVFEDELEAIRQKREKLKNEQRRKKRGSRKRKQRRESG